MIRKILMISDCSLGLKNAWKAYGYEVMEIKERFQNNENELIEKMLLLLKGNNHIEYVFSFDFIPVVAEICYKYNVIYISWVFDSPHSTLWNKAACYETNRIFIFDFALWQDVAESGNGRAYYLPLSTDVEMFDDIIGRDGGKNKQKYAVDVSFMGNLYDKAPHNLFDQIQYLPPYVKGYLDSVMAAQRHIWGQNMVHTALTDSVWQEIKENVKLELDTEYNERVYEDFVEGIIHKKITQLERKEMCSYLARHFDFALYTGSDTSFDETIDNRGYVDYVREMPFVFHYSKINVNITLHSITTGIPLRLLDILACGGFVITNYQEEIAAYFQDGVELVIYKDFSDLYEKITYYLEHEEERENIARAGYEKVKNQFDYIHGVEKIVSVLEGENVG